MSDVTLNVLDPVGPEDGDLLVLGHSLGTSAAIWEGTLPSLSERYRVIRWELPGHGDASPTRRPYRVEDVSEALLAQLDRRGVEVFHYAGISIGGCIGLDLSLRFPDRLSTLTVVSSGARVDDPALMRGRAVTARESGMQAFVAPLRGRWFAPSTPASTVERVLDLLRQTDAESYAVAAEALADFDASRELARITTRLLAVGGMEDQSVPFARSRELAKGVPRGVAAGIPYAGHSVVAEQPGAFARTLMAFLEG